MATALPYIVAGASAYSASESHQARIDSEKRAKKQDAILADQKKAADAEQITTSKQVRARRAVRRRGSGGSQLLFGSQAGIQGARTTLG